MICSNDIDDIYANNDEYNPNKKRKILIAFDGMICWYAWLQKSSTDSNRDLFVRLRKINISLVFITQFCLGVPNNNRLKSPN